MQGEEDLRVTQHHGSQMLPHPTSDQPGGYQTVGMTCQSASLMHDVLGTLGAPSQARGHYPTGALHTPYMRSASNANLTPRIWGILQGRKSLIPFCLTRGEPEKKILVATQLGCIVGEPRL